MSDGLQGQGSQRGKVDVKFPLRGAAERGQFGRELPLCGAANKRGRLSGSFRCAGLRREAD